MSALALLVAVTPPESLLFDGDLVVAVLATDKTPIKAFRVSSQVLRVASTVFSGLIDAAHTTCDGRKIVFIHDGSEIEAEAIRCILSVLHHTNADIYKSLSTADLLQVSKCNIFLQCNKALAPWISRWCQTLVDKITESDQPKTEQLGMLLKSLDNFEVGEEIFKLKKFTVRNLPIFFLKLWATDENLKGLLSSKFLDGLSDDIATLFALVIDEISSVDAFPHIRSELYPTGRLICPRCGRRHPGNAKACHPCRNKTLHEEFCTNSSRVGEYFRILSINELWPPKVLRRDDMSICQISQRLSDMARDIPHCCEAGLKCPLVVRMNALPGKLNRIVEGYSLGE